ncbi:InlB B-repeat-containing protein [Faecalibacterium faecis]|uniref:Bacterial repeat domain-containing protein n=1 Tax=Faecalibacterium faecis TaxID=3133157 RepID=A0ABV1BP53_9FIRM
MRKKSTRLLSAALAVCMMLSVLPVGAFAAEPGAAEPENGVSAQADAAVPEGYIAINEKNFPDKNFRDYVAGEWDKNLDNRFSPSEIANAKWITCDNKEISNLKGIQFFTNIWLLECYYDNLTTIETIDLSNNKNLSKINCIYNKLEELDVSELPLLKEFYCDGNKLQSIDVSENKKLKDFSCKENSLGTLNVSQNKELERLVCGHNNLTKLDVSENKKLKEFWCYENKLSNLDLGNQTELEVLSCAKNPLSVLDVSANTNLKKLLVSNTNLTELNVSANTNLEKLDVSNTNLTSLDATNNTALETFIGKDCSYNIAVEGDGKFDLTTLPGKFDASKATATGGGTINENENILTVDPNSKTFRYDYDIGQNNKKMNVVLNVHWHNYKWNHDGTKHWRECTTANCPGLTDAQEAPHVYDNAKDKDCNTCGYVRPLYTVTTVNATAKLESEAEELKAPVAAGTEVILTAGNAPEGKTFAGWKLYNVSDTESEITDETELAKLLKNGIATTATLTLTMPAYNVKAEPYYSDIPYNITAVNCTVDKTKAAKGDTVTATRRALKANERFTGWTVKVNGVEQDPDTFLKPNTDDPAKVSFTMPAENVEIKANFEGNPTLNIGDHVTANIDGSDASVPSGSTVPVGETVHLTAIAPEGQHFTGWTVKVGGEEADNFLTPDKNDPTKATFTMPSKNVEVTATFAEDSIPEPDPVGPSDTGNIQGAISAVVVGAAAGAIIYEAGTGIYRVINMPGIPMPSNRIELAELLWEHAGKPEPVSTALYSDIEQDDTDAQKAAHWAVEQDLMKDDADNNKFHPAFPVSKLRTCLTWNAAKEKGLFDKTEE